MSYQGRFYTLSGAYLEPKPVQKPHIPIWVPGDSEATRQLAAWAAILGVPAAIAGTYGMTFPNIHVLDAPYQYSILAGAMILICLGLYIRFRKLHWL